MNHGEVEGRGPMPCPVDPDPPPATEGFVLPKEVPDGTAFELPHGVGAAAAEELKVCGTLICAHGHAHATLVCCLLVIADGGLLECGTPAQLRWLLAALMCAAVSLYG